ncbi:MAG: PAS domain S-box protein, partial [Azospira sp.]|nr:PAS domain S-box protein [Azospira sp.]
MKMRPISSFVARLIWLAMLPLLLLSGGLSWQNLQEQEEKHLREGARLAQNLVRMIDQHLRARINALNMLAISPLADDPRRWPELYAEAQGFKTSFGIPVIFADDQRQMLFNTRLPYSAPLPRLPDSKGRTAASLALNTGKPQVGDIVISPIDGKPLVAIAVPVLRPDKPTRLMLSIFETSHFQKRIDELALPAGWSITLQDGTGADIARRSPAGFDAERDVAEDHRFVVPLDLSAWAVVLEIPHGSHWEAQIRTIGYLGAFLLLATLFGMLGGTLAGRRLGRQVQALAGPPDKAMAFGITEIAEARRVLDETAAKAQTNEKRFSRLFQEAPVALCFVNKEGVLIDRNRRFDETFGYERDEVRTLDDWWSLAYPDPAYRTWVLDIWNATVAKAARTGRDIEPVEYRVRCKDGRERIMLISGITLGEDFLATFFDVTEHRRAQEALRESQERLQLLIDHAPASLAMFDRDMRYLAVSRRWREDYALGDHPLLGHSHYEIFPEIPERWREAHRRGLAGQVVVADEDSFERADGSVQWLRWEVRPWHARDASIGGIVIFSENITHLVRARHEIIELNAGLERRVEERTAELAAANRELESFAYAVSHDLRAPLRAMRGFSQALEEDYGDRLQGEAKTFLDQIVVASRRMSELIDGLLALSRSTRGELRRDAVDLSALARRRLDELARQEPGRQVSVEVEDGLVARGDAHMLEAALGNLLDNAWKYTGRSDTPTIRVHRGEVDGREGFCVTDNGAGFDPA